LVFLMWNLLMVLQEWHFSHEILSFTVQKYFHWFFFFWKFLVFFFLLLLLMKAFCVFLKECQFSHEILHMLKCLGFTH
jgi:hypothetical protein